MKKPIYCLLAVVILAACRPQSKLPKIAPDVITETTLHDSDDPAIWINKKNPEESIIFGTDKDSDGAIYAFDLDGKIIESKTIRDVKRPNNVDIAYDFKLGNTVTDVMVYTEREKQQIRLFSVPDMKPLDNGGFPVFIDEEDIDRKSPMGVAFYHSPKTGSMYVIVSRKSGAATDYLFQYLLEPKGDSVTATLARKFGNFSERKEIEAIAVDTKKGFVYYSDENHCIRKYHAEPSMGNEELACFGGEYFLNDIEGIAIAEKGENGYLIVSNQGLGEFNLFDRNTNDFVKAVNLSTKETDGCDVVTVSLGEKFPNGVFVAMNDEKNFYFYDINRIFE